MLSYNVAQIPKTVKIILVATAIVYFIQLFANKWLLPWGALIPSAVFMKGEIWRLGTYMFMHDTSTPFHLLFNMLALWMFGCEIEQMWGSRRFAWFYAISGVGSALFSVIMWNSMIVGASGAVLALLTVYAWYFPNRTVFLFFVFEVPVRFAVLIFGLLSVFGAMGHGGGIAHLTHLGGIVVAVLYLRYYDRTSAWIVQRKQDSVSKQQAAIQEENRTKERFFAEVIDPILKKISEQGMESLTEDEKKKLKSASRTGSEQFKKRKIVPFDSFRD